MFCNTITDDIVHTGNIQNNIPLHEQQIMKIETKSISISSFYIAEDFIFSQKYKWKLISTFISNLFHILFESFSNENYCVEFDSSTKRTALKLTPLTPLIY